MAHEDCPVGKDPTYIYLRVPEKYHERETQWTKAKMLTLLHEEAKVVLGCNILAIADTQGLDHQIWVSPNNNWIEGGWFRPNEEQRRKIDALIEEICVKRKNEWTRTKKVTNVR